MAPKEGDKLGYRPCVGVMLVNREGQVFVGRRRGMKGGGWQMPQGGIDAGEEPAHAALRELAEEAGTDRAEIVAESAGWHRYDLPDELVGKALRGRYRGQEQKWFLARFTGSDADIDIATKHPEFDDWRWVPPDRLVDLIVPFKRPVYVAVVQEFLPLIERA